MISRNGLNHHLNNIEHHAGIFARTASELADASVQNSKGVILKAFDNIYRGPEIPASKPYTGEPCTNVPDQAGTDQKFCKWCESFFPLQNSEVIEWHDSAACRKRIEVSLDWHTIDDYPGKRQQFRDLQRSRPIPAKALEGYKVREVFGDSAGRLIVVYEKIGEEF